MKITMKQAARLMTTKGLKGIGTLLHSVVVLIVFWMAIELVQQHVVAGPQRPGMMMTALGPGAINPRDYGYFSHPQQTALAERTAVAAKTQPVAKVSTPKPTAVAKARVKSIVLAKATPRRPAHHESIAWVRVAQAPKPASCKQANWAPWCQESKSL